MEHHALIGVHNEGFATRTVHLPEYNTLSDVTAGQPHDVGKLGAYSTSDFLSARYIRGRLALPPRWGHSLRGMPASLSKRWPAARAQLR